MAMQTEKSSSFLLCAFLLSRVMSILTTQTEGLQGEGQGGVTAITKDNTILHLRFSGNKVKQPDGSVLGNQRPQGGLDLGDNQQKDGFELRNHKQRDGFVLGNHKQKDGAVLGNYKQGKP